MTLTTTFSMREVCEMISLVKDIDPATQTSDAGKALIYKCRAADRRLTESPSSEGLWVSE